MLYSGSSSKLDTEEQAGFKRAEEKGENNPGRGNSTNKGIRLRGAEDWWKLKVDEEKREVVWFESWIT